MFLRNHDTISTRNDQIVLNYSNHMRTLKSNNSLTAYKRQRDMREGVSHIVFVLYFVW
jgi:hypothetical protein